MKIFLKQVCICYVRNVCAENTKQKKAKQPTMQTVYDDSPMLESLNYHIMQTFYTTTEHKNFYIKRIVKLYYYYYLVVHT